MPAARPVGKGRTVTLQVGGHPVRFDARTVLSAVAVLFIGIFILRAAPAFSAMTETAPVQVTQPDGKTALTSGGSATSFDLIPPVNSHCTGDSATGHYLV